jgi:hypothetical protein
VEGGAALHLQAPVLSLEGFAQLAPAEQAVRSVAGGATLRSSTWQMSLNVSRDRDVSD